MWKELRQQSQRTWLVQLGRELLLARTRELNCAD